MYDELTRINHRPLPFERYTAEELWTDQHTAQEMLRYHLDEDLAMASRTREFIEASVNWLEKRFGLGPGSSVADFGCGPGLYTTALARLGANVTGIDFSANSVAVARETAAREGLEIDYRLQNYLEFASEHRFDLITMIMCDFCALSPDQRTRLLGIFRAHLATGGAICLDVYSLASFEQRQEGSSYEFRQLDGFWAAGDYYGFLSTFKYSGEHVVLDKYTIVEPHRTRQIFNWLQYFSPESLTSEFAECDLNVREVLGDIAGRPHSENGPELAIVADSIS